MDARLEGAYLREVHGLTLDQVVARVPLSSGDSVYEKPKASWDEKTRFPGHLAAGL
jgi:hypothetical protein